MIDADRTLVECDLDALRTLVAAVEARHDVRITREPVAVLAMIRAADSLEGQPFYLGEAVTTECEVTVSGRVGYGVCLGDAPQRGYCLAVVDALLHSETPPTQIADFVAAQAAVLDERRRAEIALLTRSRVDFKLMDQE